MKAIKKPISRGILHNNQGFAMIAALMALLMLTAVGALVFTVTTQDIRVSTRVVGEKKAFSAAQAGIHGYVDYLFKLPDNPHVNYLNNALVKNYTISDVQIDPGGDPASRYAIGNPTPIAGVNPDCIVTKSVECENPTDYQRSSCRGKTIQKNVTGRNVNYNSSVTIDYGICYGPM